MKLALGELHCKSKGFKLVMNDKGKPRGIVATQDFKRQALKLVPVTNLFRWGGRDRCHVPRCDAPEGDSEGALATC